VQRILIATAALLICLSVGTAHAAPMALLHPASVSTQDTSSSCADPVTAAPTSPATVSVTNTAYGPVLVDGSQGYAGCSLYLLTSDQVHAVSGTPFACSDNANPLGKPCDSVLWPALLTNGAPIAGPGVKPKLLGTVTRTDLPGLGSVQQVTYAGYPLYRFFLDETAGETEGANLFDPVTTLTGTWYLVHPGRGLPATGPAQIQFGSVAGQTVLTAMMNNDFSAFPEASFPVYTLTADSGQQSACTGPCALYWQPVLTSGPPKAGDGVAQQDLGTITRPDHTHQVTYKGQPLYLFVQDAYIQKLVGAAGVNGAGALTPWGMFNSIGS